MAGPIVELGIFFQLTGIVSQRCIPSASWNANNGTAVGALGIMHVHQQRQTRVHAVNYIPNDVRLGWQRPCASDDDKQKNPTLLKMFHGDCSEYRLDPRLYREMPEGGSHAERREAWAAGARVGPPSPALR